MKILVTFKRVPDTASASSFSTGEGGQWIINPFDEIAIEEALRIRERGEASEVVGVTIGSAAAEEQVRSALAMGIDRAIRIDDSRILDSYAVSRLLAALVRKENPSLVLMGKQAVDDDSNQAGQMLAGVLGWPQATFISKLQIDNGTARCSRETDRGIEMVEMKLPAILTCDLRLNEPRYVSLPGLMKAKRRPIELVTPGELGVSVAPKATIVSTSAPARRAAGVKVTSVDELVGRLREEKVI